MTQDDRLPAEGCCEIGSLGSGARPNEVLAFLVSLDVSGEIVRGYAAHLSKSEAARAALYRRHLDRRRYIVARGALRILLSEITGGKPCDVPLNRTASGKPRLDLPRHDAHGLGDLHFNLSHSGDCAIVAAARHVRVGVDIEQIDPAIRAEALAKRFLSGEEADALTQLPVDKRIARFFSIWTRKEAYVKARGEKIANRLRTFAVSGEALPAGGLLSDDLDPTAAARWRIVDLDAPQGYAAALAVEQIDAQPLMIGWPHRPA